ncbi:MAG: FAD-dependent oxidoreductase [bacterium]|nr:FAD-dependent oxidoreductase [bacterium]
MTARLPERPGEVIDRSSSLPFRWNGGDYTGMAGDTIVSALAASGVRVLSRSFKYRRPRGVMTADFNDPNCLFQVGDEPNVRAAHRLLEPGMDTSSQTSWPSLRFDAKAATQALSPFLGPGFYYKTFMRPRFLWPVYQRVLRTFAAGGKPSPQPGHSSPDKRYAHPDVLVAGGGPAGMMAAISAAERGARVMLVDEQHETGGYLRWSDSDGRLALADLRTRLAAADVEVLTDSVVFGRYDHNWVGVMQRSHPQGERLIKARAGVLVVAPGLIERPLAFEGNDLPGVVLSGAARRLLNLYAVRPGTRAVVLSANAEGAAAAADLADAGVEIAAFVDARAGETVVRAKGRTGVRSVELTGGKTVEADLLVTATGWTAPTALLNMAGVVPTFDPESSRFVPGEMPDDVMATGGIVGDGSVADLLSHAAAVGQEAARRSGHKAVHKAAAIPAAAALAPPSKEPVELPTLEPEPHPPLFIGSTSGFIDFSEDVTTKDITAAADEGYRSLELAKRYTTATMGPTQGKLEVINAGVAHAIATGRAIAGMGTTTWRPPYAPVSLGALAGRMLEPVRHSPLQPYHERVGAQPIVAGQWIRPNHYGDPAAEVTAVRSSVGVIDVSPLGKIELRGRDVPKLLELVYTNKWSKLAVGSVRYGIMCAEDGVVMDDGVTARFAEDRYMMTTTSSGAAGVYDWLEEWLATAHPDWDVRLTAMTDAYASMNVAGPESRALLERLVEGIELDAESFPHMHVRTGTVAGVADCFLWRLGFTGELSFEVHVPAGYGLHVWEALLEQGADLGAVPFGLEAQRIMRLEKGHFIVGQDTDGLTRAHSTGLSTLINSDKPDFSGKQELEWSEADSGTMLVALQPEDPAVVPPEASQVLSGNTLVGRITSSRMSPTLGRSICLAQLTQDHAAPGTVVTVHLPDRTRVRARVMEHHAHFDPEGSRLRG